MRRLYSLLLALLVPVFTVRLFWKSRRNRGYREHWTQRFALFDSAGLRKTLWIHAVSVGEVVATQELVRKLRESCPQTTLVISTTTPTGAERVESLYGDTVRHFYFPYDVNGIVRRWLAHVDPVMLILMETEIWPNLLLTCESRGIPVILANGRLSSKSAAGYARLPVFSRRIFQSITRVAAQSDDDARRFAALGVPDDRLAVTGSVKFDTRQPALVREQAEAMRRVIGSGRPVWIAASTREGEEEAVLEAHRQVLERLPEALMILVPRHPERFDRVAQLCQQRGFSMLRRSSNQVCSPQHQVFLGDSMGELAMMYQVADLAFVGGSLVDSGGQNVLEPASFGLPVLFGPSMYNFAAISELLLLEQAALRVDDAHALAEQVVAWLSDASERTGYGENARSVVEANRGATDRLLSLIAATMP